MTALGGVVNPDLLLRVFSPWLIGVLILMGGRKCCLRLWTAPLVLALVALALVLCEDWLAGRSGLPSHGIPLSLGLLLINILLIGGSTFIRASHVSQALSGMPEWSLIPVWSFWVGIARTWNTYWCASCEAMYWRSCEGEWKKERRRAWLELPSTTKTPA